jgi:hypothetical protein
MSDASVRAALRSDESLVAIEAPRAVARHTRGRTMRERWPAWPKGGC